ncbi:MAG: hypothetical protein IJ658_07355, partial [Kiritimatiellae bacterium]|nr:hypothetical protein [Kiritimatiellia bacterium]
MRIALLGNVTLDFLAQDFRRMGHEAYVPSGFDTWRQEALDPTSGLRRFAPDATLLLLPDLDILAVLKGAAAIERLSHLSDSDLQYLASIPLSALAAETSGFWDDR